MKNKTIIELWKHNGEQLPFAVRRNTWSDSHYAVIHEVKPGKWPYGHAFGIYFFGGKPKTEAPEQISSAGCYQWELVEGFGFKKGEYKGKKKALRVYRKDEMFDFGKYFNSGKGMKSIEEVFKDDPTYIKWCLENVENFCLVPEELAELNPEDPQKRIGRKLRKINHERFESLELNNAVDPTKA